MSNTIVPLDNKALDESTTEATVTTDEVVLKSMKWRAAPGEDDRLEFILRDAGIEVGSGLDHLPSHCVPQRRPTRGEKKSGAMQWQ